MERTPARTPARTPSSSSRIPAMRSTALRTTTTSTLGKRPAADPGFGDDPAQIRKALSASKARESNLERRVFELERSLRQRDAEVRDQHGEIETLKNERRILYEGETREVEEGSRREEQWQQERKDYVARISELRRQNQGMADELDELKHQHSSLTIQHHKLSNEGKARVKTLEARLMDLEGERGVMMKWKSRADALGIELEEVKRKAEENALRSGDSVAEARANEMVRTELRRQSNNLHQLQRTNETLQTEVAELRRVKKEADTVDLNAKERERKLQHQVQALHEQLRQARHEVDVQSGASEDGQAAQRLAALSALHSEVKDELTAKSKRVDELLGRLGRVGHDSQSTNLDLAKRLKEAETQLRWAKEGRAHAESNEKLARRELETWRASRAAAAAAGAGPEPAAQAGRITELEALVDEYKATLAGFERDSRETEERIARGQGFVKTVELDAALGRAKALETDAAELQATVEALTAANEKLDGEMSELMLRVASGEFNPARERCLELRGNPAAKIHAVRRQELEALSAENAALLARRAEVDTGAGAAGGALGEGLVPRASYERLAREQAAQQAAHEKRLLRLKEIFGLKSREFLESVYSLLGWRIRFDESGADVRLTSMYAPKGKMGLTLKFASHEGHFGTMQMSGGMARGLEEARDFWVVQRQSIPGFLAQVTTEMFEKTTMGRAAGYVGVG